jgi:hypothetical protein
MIGTTGTTSYFFTATRFAEPSTTTNPHLLRVGFFDTASGGPVVDGAWFEYTHTLNEGRWYCRSNNGDSVTGAFDSGITFVGNTWYDMKIVVGRDSNSTAVATYYINDVSVGSLTGNRLPVGLLRETGCGWMYYRTGTGLQITGDIDYMLYVMERSG